MKRVMRRNINEKCGFYPQSRRNVGRSVEWEKNGKVMRVREKKPSVRLVRLVRNNGLNPTSSKGPWPIQSKPERKVPCRHLLKTSPIVLTTLTGRKSKKRKKKCPIQQPCRGIIWSSSTWNPEHDDEQAATKAGQVGHGRGITYRSTEPSSPSGRKSAASRCSLARQPAGCSFPGYQGFPCG